MTAAGNIAVGWDKRAVSIEESFLSPIGHRNQKMKG